MPRSAADRPATANLLAEAASVITVPVPMLLPQALADSTNRPSPPKVETAKEEDRRGFMESHWLAVGSSILLLGFLVGFLLLWLCWANSNPLLGLGLLGICVLLGTLLGGNFLSNDMDLTTGEVRRSITLAVLVVFFVGLGLVGSVPDGDKEPLKTFLGTFTWIVMTVIGFYFGGRSIERFAEARLGPAGPLTDLTGELVDDLSGKLRSGVPLANVEEHLGHLAATVSKLSPSPPRLR